MFAILCSSFVPWEIHICCHVFTYCPIVDMILPFSFESRSSELVDKQALIISAIVANTVVWPTFCCRVPALCPPNGRSTREPTGQVHCWVFAREPRPQHQYYFAVFGPKPRKRVKSAPSPKTGISWRRKYWRQSHMGIEKVSDLLKRAEAAISKG